MFDLTGNGSELREELSHRDQVLSSPQTALGCRKAVWAVNEELTRKQDSHKEQEEFIDEERGTLTCPRHHCPKKHSRIDRMSRCLIAYLRPAQFEVFKVSTVYRRSPTIEMAPLQDETILFDPQKNQFCLLNRTASFIWSQLATPASSHALGSKICQSFTGVALDNAVRDANGVLEEMRSLNFVEEETHAGDQP